MIKMYEYLKCTNLLKKTMSSDLSDPHCTVSTHCAVQRRTLVSGLFRRSRGRSGPIGAQGHRLALPHQRRLLSRGSQDTARNAQG